MKPKTLIICQSVHHGNTMKIARVLSDEFHAEIVDPSEVRIETLKRYDLIGFGSGIFDDMHLTQLLDLTDRLPNGNGQKTFIFSTSGVPVAILGDKFLSNYSIKAHSALKKRLESKGYRILGEFISPGFNTNIFLKYFGGLNKNRPNHKDCMKAREFALKIKRE